MPDSLVPTALTHLNLPKQIETLTQPAQASLAKVDKVAENVVKHGGDWAVQGAFSLFIIVLGWWLGSLVAPWVQRALMRARMDETTASFLGSLARYALFFALVVVALNVAGVNGTSLLAIFGAIGLAVAFALRGTLTHVAAGVMIVSARPFKVGDYIQVGKDGLEGTVKRITLFNTELNTLQNLRIFIPNTQIWEGLLINHSYNNQRMIEFKIPLSPAQNPMSVKLAIHKFLTGYPRLLQAPEPFVGIDTITETTIWFTLRVWAQQTHFADIRYNLLGNLANELTEQGFHLAYPRLHTFTNAPTHTPLQPGSTRRPAIKTKPKKK